MDSGKWTVDIRVSFTCWLVLNCSPRGNKPGDGRGESVVKRLLSRDLVGFELIMGPSNHLPVFRQGVISSMCPMGKKQRLIICTAYTVRW